MKASKIKLVKKRTDIIFLFQALKFHPIDDMTILNVIALKIVQEGIVTMIITKTVC